MQKAVPRNYVIRCRVTVKHSSRNSRCQPNGKPAKWCATSFDPRSGGAGIGWGQRQIRRENGEPSYNLFVSKPLATGKGQSLKSPRLNMKWRSEESKSEVSGLQLVSGRLSDYVGLLTRNPRYAAVTTARVRSRGRRPYRTRAMPPILLCPQTHQHDSADEIDKRQGDKTYSMNIDNLF